MNTQATAIYEKGTLRLLTPVSLPEKTRVRVQILSEEAPEDDMRRAEAALAAAGLIKPATTQPKFRKVSRSCRAELARIYAAGGPLSETIVAERDAQ